MRLKVSRLINNLFLIFKNFVFFSRRYLTDKIAVNILHDLITGHDTLKYTTSLCLQSHSFRLSMRKYMMCNSLWRCPRLFATTIIYLDNTLFDRRAYGFCRWSKRSFLRAAIISFFKWILILTSSNFFHRTFLFTDHIKSAPPSRLIFRKEFSNYYYFWLQKHRENEYIFLTLFRLIKFNVSSAYLKWLMIRLLI